MPKTKLNNENPLQRLIQGYWKTGLELCKVLGCSDKTATKKFNHPGQLTLDDLKALNRHGIPIKEIKVAIFGEDKK